MRYGVPYKGSKNSIAEWIYKHLPKLTNFYDLFAGGCAITQIALMKQEYKNYFCNDIDNSGIQLFLNAIYGRYKDEKRWISREDFFRLKDSDPYIKYCWSFGNNGRDYLYSKEIEPYKKAWHFAIYENDFTLAKKLGMELEPIKEIPEINKKYQFSKRVIEEITERKQYSGLVRQQQLEALNRLQSLQSLQSLHSSYSAINIKPDSVIYCDIPYISTNTYGDKKDNHNFNYLDFYFWCRKQKEIVIISEYWMPEDFICIAEIEKKVNLCSGANHSAIEKLFIPKHQGELYEKIKPKFSVQQEFDFS